MLLKSFSGSPGRGAAAAAAGWLIWFALPGCVLSFPENDGVEALMLLPVAESDASTGEGDTVAPTFGGLTTSTVTSTSTVDLAWTAATDDVTASGALVYEICASTTAGSCQTAFTANYTSTAGATSLTASGLTGNTVYYFVARARDEAANLDSNTAEISAQTSVIKIWAGSGNTPIASGFTRASIDATCNATILAGCLTAAGLISFSATDEIRDMPANYGVQTNVRINGPGVLKIADNWADLLDGVIDRTMEGAGVLGSSTHTYWTGSDGNGALLNNCTNWTSTAGGDTGTFGIANRSNTRWLTDSTGGGTSPGGCGGSRRHLCICW